jgi:ABC-2 type transport system ATP-binding protein
MNFLETNHLSKTYPNGVEAVKSLDLKIQKGQVYGLIGPNGAGKTTTIRVLMGIFEPTSGTVTFDGASGLDLSRTGYLPEGASFYRFMEVREYLEWSCHTYEISDCEGRINDALATVEMENLAQRGLDELSKGQKQRVGIAQALVHDPDLLILDEPTSGLDPMGKQKILDIISGLADRGKTILTSSHILPELSQICTGVGIIRDGELVLQGSMKELKKKFSTSRIEVGFESSPDGLLDRLKDLGYVNVLEEIDEEGLRYLIKVGNRDKAKRELPGLLFNSDSVVTYYDFARVTLEDIFMQTMGGANQ